MDNTSLFFLIFHLSGHNLFLDDLMIFGARYLIIIVFVLILYFTFTGTTKERKAFFLTMISMPITLLIIWIIHFFLATPRPFVAYHIIPLYPFDPNPAFPSHHTAIMAVVAFAYTLFKSKWAALFLALMVLVGISRIYVGVHYPVDILGGILVGMISLFIGKQIVKLLRIRLYLS